KFSIKNAKVGINNGNMFKKNTLLPHSSKQKKDKPSVSLKIGTFVNGIKNSTLLVLQRMHHK
ncbi:MAG: hypothetical protein WCS11_08095, partial [Dysgonamonadaceae bacterium]